MGCPSRRAASRRAASRRHGACRGGGPAGSGPRVRGAGSAAQAELAGAHWGVRASGGWARRARGGMLTNDNMAAQAGRPRAPLAPRSKSCGPGNRCARSKHEMEGGATRGAGATRHNARCQLVFQNRARTQQDNARRTAPRVAARPEAQSASYGGGRGAPSMHVSGVRQQPTAGGRVTLAGGLRPPRCNSSPHLSVLPLGGPCLQPHREPEACAGPREARCRPWARVEQLPAAGAAARATSTSPRQLAATAAPAPWGSDKHSTSLANTNVCNRSEAPAWDGFAGQKFQCKKGAWRRALLAALHATSSTMINTAASQGRIPTGRPGHYNPGRTCRLPRCNAASRQPKPGALSRGLSPAPLALVAPFAPHWYRPALVAGNSGAAPPQRGSVLKCVCPQDSAPLVGTA